MPRQFHERPMDAALQLWPANACSRCGHERSCPGSEYAAVLLAEKGLKGHARALLSMAARYKSARCQYYGRPRGGGKSSGHVVHTRMFEDDRGR